MTTNDTTGREIASPSDLRPAALHEAATISGQHTKHGHETFIVVTVCDITGAVCLKVRLIAQMDGP